MTSPVPGVVWLEGETVGPSRHLCVQKALQNNRLETECMQQNSQMCSESGASFICLGQKKLSLVLLGGRLKGKPP